MENKRKNLIKYLVSIVIVFTLIIIFTAVFSGDMKIKNKNYYKEKSRANYNVYLKENDYFEEEYLEKENSYIASLIDYIDAELTYNLNLAHQESGVYNYRIVAEVDVKDDDSEESYYTYNDELENVKNVKFSNSTVSIDESVKVDYNKYNDLIKNFVDLYELDEQTSAVKICMYVDLEDDSVRANSKDPVVSIEIPLTTKTININIVSNEMEKMSQNVKCTDEPLFYVTAVLTIIEVILIINMILYINGTKDNKSLYKMQLKNIKRVYGGYIQKIEDEKCYAKYSSIEMQSFEDLLKIKETLNMPLLMLEKENETFFFVPTENKIVYIFNLNDGQKKIRIASNDEQKEEITK